MVDWWWRKSYNQHIYKVVPTTWMDWMMKRQSHVGAPWWAKICRPQGRLEKVFFTYVIESPFAAPETWKWSFGEELKVKMKGSCIAYVQ